MIPSVLNNYNNYIKKIFFYYLFIVHPPPILIFKNFLNRKGKGLMGIGAVISAQIVSKMNLIEFNIRFG